MKMTHSAIPEIFSHGWARESRISPISWFRIDRALRALSSAYFERGTIRCWRDVDSAATSGVCAFYGPLHSSRVALVRAGFSAGNTLALFDLVSHRRRRRSLGDWPRVLVSEGMVATLGRSRKRAGPCAVRLRHAASGDVTRRPPGTDVQ